MIFRRLMYPLFSLVSFGLFAPISDAAPGTVSAAYTWKNVAIVAGGFVPGIEYSPVQPNLVYARTDMGGAYRWNEPTKRWIPLTDWAGGAEANFLGIESIAPDPVDKNKVYIEVGTYLGNWVGNGALLRSTNQGRTFLRADLPFKVGGNENGRSMGERLAVDACKNSILFLGSRQAGLWRSDDSGATWSNVGSFPVPGDSNGIGISTVVFDSARSRSGSPTRDIYVGATNSATPIYHSGDGGTTWAAVPGQPAGLMPHQARVDRRGMVYITYTDAPGPNGINGGAVWKFDPGSGSWTDITPIHPNQNGESGFGYSGLSLDPQHPGTLVVSTLDRWSRGDDIFRTSDDGITWHGMRQGSVRDDSISPWLTFGKAASSFGWWTCGIALDPFHPQHIIYGTGATIWSSWDAVPTTDGQATHWAVGGLGIEECAVLALASPPSGPHLISGVGDIGGFTHEDLDQSPSSGMFTHPIFTNTDSIDFAGQAPQIVVRTGRGGDNSPGGYSGDGGATWTPFGQVTGFRRGGGGIAVSADGSTLVMSGSYSIDKGATWTPCQGLPQRSSVISDRISPKVFYAVDQGGTQLLVSNDSAMTFATVAALPMSGNVRLYASPFAAGDIWISSSSKGVYRSADGGVTFTKIDGAGDVQALSFGKAAPGATYPAVYVSGEDGGENWISRSDDMGSTWIRINDSQHQYGFTSNEISGDPRVYGRVYVATNGRGIIMGDIAQRVPVQ